MQSKASDKKKGDIKFYFKKIILYNNIKMQLLIVYIIS